MRFRNTKRLVKQAQIHNANLFTAIGVTPILGALTTAAITVLVLHWFKYNGKIDLPTFTINWITFGIFSSFAAASILAYTGTYVYQEITDQDINKYHLGNTKSPNYRTDLQYTKYNAYTVSNPISIIVVLSIACAGMVIDTITYTKGLSFTNPKKAGMSTEMSTPRTENLSSENYKGI